MKTENGRLIQLKRIFKVVNGGTPSTTEHAYWDGDITWVTPEDLGKLNCSILTQSRRGLTSEGILENGLELCPPGSIILSTRAPIGHLAIAGIPLCTNQGCRVLVPIRTCETRYFWYQLQAFRSELESLGQGSTFRELGSKDLASFRLAVANKERQKLLVSFLDAETSKIDDLVAKKQRLIELLDEKRSALISRAVTQGIDPSVPMKDSGVEWLGSVPAHWVSQALRHVCSIKEGQIDPADERYLDWILIAPNHVKSNTGEIILMESAREQAAISGKYLAKKGSIIYSKIRPALNKVCIAEIDCLCSADMYPVYPNERVLNPFLKYRFLSVDFVNAMVNESMRVAMPKVNRSTFLSCRIPVPPIEEQHGIVDWIETKCSEIVPISAKCTEAIELLREYRSALITAAVTGQLDIREHEEKLEALAG